jgi:Cof subfamily protein (haloacid dehalogenase superfamily)
MIKLIACDLDGTLLPPSKVMPDETFGLIERLWQKGIIFAPASGRQLPNLKKLFAPVLNKIAIIAENGGLAWLGGEVIYSNPTPPDSVKYALDIIRKESDLYPLVSCADCAFYESDYPPFVEVLKRSYSSEKLVNNLDEVIYSNQVLKISVWDPLVSAEHGGKILPNKIEGLRTMVSGFDWLDVCVEGANKGKALMALAKHLGVERGSIAAFGDHMNDLEMLEYSGKPYVTANAFPLLKQKIGEQIASNAEFGVIQKLKQILAEN